MDELEQSILKMISYGGEGKSLSFQAIQLAEEDRILEAEEKLLQAKASIEKGKQAHCEVLVYEANHQDDFQVTALLIHAADYVSNGDDVYEMAKHFLTLFKRMKGGKEDV